MSGFVQRVARFIREEHLLEPDSLVLVGVSGGVDSMVLLEVLVRLDYPVTAAHVNYGLRGEASAADEQLVRHRCAHLKVALEVARYPTRAIAEERGGSIQEVARELRYAFFLQVAEAAGAPSVAVAHHADDQAETVLLHLFRGTGLEGLAAMPPARALSEAHPILLVRPLLKERRSSIEAYARRREIPWREDAGNESEDYLRTHIRSRLLPVAVSIFDGRVSERIARTADIVRAYATDVLLPELTKRFEACAVDHGDGGLLRHDVLQQAAGPMKLRLILAALQRWLPGVRRDAATAERIAALSESQVGRFLRFGSGEVWRERDGIWFMPLRQHSSGAPEEGQVPLEDGTYAVPGGRLVLQRTWPPLDLCSADEWTAVMDASAILSPLRVRIWRPGDEIEPLGMGGRSKKVSDLLTDARVPSHDRARVVVVTADGRVIWVPGVRLAELVRIGAGTESAWVARYIPNEE